MSLLDHIYAFQAAAIRYKGAGGKMSEDNLGQKLLISVNNENFADSREITVKGIKGYNNIVTKFKKWLVADRMLHHNLNVSSPPCVTQATEASATSWNNWFNHNNKNRCMQTRCVGLNHSPEEFFQRPGNEHLQKAWISNHVKMALHIQAPSSATLTDIHALHF
ncbi:hypothetical protein CROQUDRAFT_136598 [Cronartium quercuum f. sp. fusiforme G11]|uniref:Uncharacterized protein n=1 Tax=Cronartium quercuum f. sp. fusiforme G11 TaxID=708437 RepID=A0A9P6NB35_9BASI|nr:hypothetical protein CROQUDRAFT_136598 [Cronartium quercuum f. sp. fusiforme G11]